jgi:hypothetical protein
LGRSQQPSASQEGLLSVKRDVYKNACRSVAPAHISLQNKLGSLSFRTQLIAPRHNGLLWTLSGIIKYATHKTDIGTRNGARVKAAVEVVGQVVRVESTLPMSPHRDSPQPIRLLLARSDGPFSSDVCLYLEPNLAIIAYMRKIINDRLLL